MNRLLSCLICLSLCVELAAQSSIQPIQGWKMSEDDGHYSYTPASIIGSIPLNYDVFPPKKTGSADLAGWLAATVTKDLSDLHYTALPGNPNIQEIKSIQTYSIGVKDADGKQILMNYMAYTRRDGMIRYGRIVETPIASVKPYMNRAVQHFMAICRQEGGLAASPATSTGQNTSHPKSEETPVTAPGQGLKPADIKGFVIHQETGIGVGGMVIIVWRPYLLLKDGTMYSHCSVSPYDLDVARSRQMEPNQWGTWTLQGKTLTTKFPDDKTPDKWDSHWQWARPAERNEKISGAYYTISGGGNTAMGGGSMVVSSGSITFNDKGQFTRVSTGGGSYSGATGSVTAYSNKDAAGTYILDGYSLELKYNNGASSRVSFYFYPDSKEVFGLGARDYVPSKK